MSDAPQGPGWYQASDGKWYPPAQTQQYQQPQFAAPPKKGKNGCLIAALVVLALVVLSGIGIAILAAIGVGIAADKADEAIDNFEATSEVARKDVAITSCAPSADGLGRPQAKLTVTNNSSKPSNYVIVIAFEASDGSGQMASGPAYVNNVAPGKWVEADAHAAIDEGVTLKDFKCELTEVRRFAS